MQLCTILVGAISLLLQEGQCNISPKRSMHRVVYWHQNCHKCGTPAHLTLKLLIEGKGRFQGSLLMSWSSGKNPWAAERNPRDWTSGKSNVIARTQYRSGTIVIFYPKDQCVEYSTGTRVVTSVTDKINTANKPVVSETKRPTVAHVTASAILLSLFASFSA